MNETPIATTINWSTVLAIAIPSLALIVDIIHHYLESRKSQKLQLQEIQLRTIEAFNAILIEVIQPLDKFMPSDIEKILENSKQHRSEDYKNLEALFVRLLTFATGVNMGIYDQEVIKNISGHPLGRMQSRLDAFLGVKENRDEYDGIYKDIYIMLDSLRIK